MSCMLFKQLSCTIFLEAPIEETCSIYGVDIFVENRMFIPTLFVILQSHTRPHNASYNEVLNWLVRVPSLDYVWNIFSGSNQ
jgi:hypothetical protein